MVTASHDMLPRFSITCHRGCLGKGENPREAEGQKIRADKDLSPPCDLFLHTSEMKLPCNCFGVANPIFVGFYLSALSKGS